MYRLAVAYYQENLTQQEIANKFGISRVMVSRMLKQSILEKMVEIKIHPPDNEDAGLEQQLEALFGLDEVILVKSDAKVSQGILEDIGKTAAEWLVGRLDGKETVALSWGKTLHAMVNALPPCNFPDMRIVQMIGGLGEPEADSHASDLTFRMARVLNGKPRVLSSPGIVKTKEICENLKEDLQISETLRLAASADIALIGIGSFNSGSLIYDTDIILSQEDKKELKIHDAAGDISLRFFDAKGRLITGEINNRIVGLDAAQIAQIPRRVGISGGPGKLEAIHAACTGSLINVLITDRDTGEKLLNIQQNG